MKRLSTLRNGPPLAFAAGAEPATIRPVLYTRAFVTICAVALLGFGSNFAIQPVLPIMILERGGDATLVGLIIAAFSFPSVILRPFMGRLVDEWSNRRVLVLGTAGIGLSGFIYVVPNLAVIFLDRIFHGAGWAAFNASAHSMLARLAPTARRGEASSVYNLMPGIAQAVMPAVGLLLLGVTGTAGPFVLAGLLGLGAFALTTFGPLPETAATPRSAREGFWRSLLERGAILPMTLEFLFTSVSSLFLIYPPVFAASHGLPIESLAIYYPIYGGVLVGSRLITGRFIDRLPRRAIVAAGALLAVLALALATGAGSVASLTVAGVVYATAASFTSPTAMAMAIDRSDPRRIGAAMATYTLGFQLGLGLGAAIWGWIIDNYGFPAPYIGAMILQGALLALLAVTWLTARRARRQEGTGRP
ncbi:MAG: MFS transporter [Candidatus Limnocylindrales bacterium]